MKIIFDHNKANPRRPRVLVKLKGHKPHFVFEKQEWCAVRRRSKYSFVYQDQIYDFKLGIKRLVIRPNKKVKTIDN